MEFHAADEYRPLLARAGIVDYESAMTFCGGQLVSAHLGRSVVRIEGNVFLKRCVRLPHEIGREFRAMERLAAGPGPAPPPLVAHGRGPRGSLLMTARPEGALPLPEALRALAGRARRDLARFLGEKIAALHARGLSCRDLLARHLLVRPGDKVWLLDAGRLARRGSRAARARDLAALALSLPFGLASAAERLRFLAAWLEGRDGLREWVRRIDRAYRRLDRRSRHRTGRVAAAPADAAFFAAHGLASFAEFMEFSGPGAVKPGPCRIARTGGWTSAGGRSSSSATGRSATSRRRRPPRSGRRRGSSGAWDSGPRGPPPWPRTSIGARRSSSSGPRASRSTTSSGAGA